MNVEAFYGISKSKNGVHLRQILPGSVWPFSSSNDVDIEKTIEYMKLTEEKEARVAQNIQCNQSMAPHFRPTLSEGFPNRQAFTRVDITLQYRVKSYQYDHVLE